MQNGMFGFPLKDRFFVLLAAPGTTTKTAIFTAPYTGWYKVSGIAGGGAGSGTNGGSAGESAIRSELYLKAGYRCEISVGRGGIYGGVSADDTKITDSHGNVLFLLSGGAAGAAASTVGEDGLEGFRYYPDTLYVDGGGPDLTNGSYFGSGGGRQASGRGGAIAIDFPAVVSEA